MLESNLFYISYFLTGLLGGFGHCVGMCGPVVLAWSTEARPSIIDLLVYNMGRVFSYVSAGMVVGFMGSLVVFGEIYWLQRWLMGGLGVLMVLGGIGLMGQGRFRWFPGVLPVRFFRTFMQRGPFPLGLVNGFFPCGLVYTALAGVAGSAVSQKVTVLAVLQGGILMFLFGIGTSLALLIIALFTRTIQDKWRQYLYHLSGLLLSLVGGLLIWRALRI